MKNQLITCLFLSVCVSSCSPKTKNPETYQAPSRGADAVPQIFTEPTQPDGGLTPYKPAEISPEEIARRKAKNEVAPVIFGLSGGGISMQTPYAEAEELLTPALGISQRRFFDLNLAKDAGLSLGGYLVYAERIAVLWGENRAITPAVLRILSGQPGILSLLDPVGNIMVGDSLARVFSANPSEEALRSYLRRLGAAIEKRQGDYNCETAKTCRLSYLDPQDKTVIDLEFRKGFLRLVREPNDLKLAEAVFHRDYVLNARLTEALDYQLQSIGPFTTATNRTELEARLGPPMAEDVFGLLYDRAALVVRKELNPMASKTKLRALVGYQGAMNFGPTLGERYLGDSFASFVSSSDDGIQLMLTIDRALENREPNFDCRLAASPCEAFLEFDPFYNMNLIVINLEKASFRFSMGADRTWMSFEPK